MTSQTTSSIFISFSTVDTLLAIELCQAIEARGVRCFFAPRDIPSGANFANEIVEAIARSSALVLLVSESSLASPHVRREVSLAIDEKYPVIPFSVSQAVDTLPREWRYWLSAVQMVPFEGGEASAEVVVSSLDRLRIESAMPIQQREAAVAIIRPQGRVTQLDSGLTIPQTLLDSDVPPSALLRADAAATEFFGREEELTRLHSWIERDGLLLTRLVVGHGGAGKTRLAREICLRVAASGWATGFVGTDATLADEVYSGATPTLIVLDYAETRPQILRLLIGRLRVSPAAKVRLLLLARSDGDWWTSLLLESPELESILTTSPPLILRALSDTPNLAEQVYKAARSAFCTRLGVPEIQTRPRRQFAMDVTPLDVQTLALLDVMEVRSRSEPEAGHSPAERMLNHERRYLRAAVVAEGIDGLETSDMDRILAVMALLGAATEKEALDNLLRVDSSLDGRTQKKLVRLLRRLYPRHGSYLSGLKPDVIAEELISQVVVGSGRPSETSGFPSAVLHGVTRQQMERGLTILGRSAGRDHVREALFALLDGLPEDFAVAAMHVATQLEYPTPLVEALRHGIESSGLDRDGLEFLLREVPDETVALADVAADLCTKLIRMNALRADDSRAGADIARFLCDASNRFSDVGRTSEAVATALEGVEALRASSQDDSVAIELGAALSSLSNRLWEAGDAKSALEPAEESVALLDSVHAASAEQTHTRKVSAAAVNNLAFRRADLGEFGLALVSAQEAIMQFRALHDTGDLFVRSGTASALNNLASINNALGQFDLAIEAADECVERRRGQTLEDRDRFLPYLARALGNAAIAHLGSGDERGALELGEEGLDLQLILSENRPVFTWELATSGLNVAAIHISCGHDDKAVEVINLVLDAAYRHPNLRLPDPRVTRMLQSLRDALDAGQSLTRSPLRVLHDSSEPLGAFIPFGLALEYKDL
ncbi:MAG: toll/interleukin-1 receptor domain-containing protein [Candidatus Nitrotoga sp.]